MKIYISYFYNVRFFPPNIVPVSTAIWDPKWYHEGRGNNHLFKDKRGVLNGLRLEPLSPKETGDESCVGCEDRDPSKCTFIKNYRSHLESLDFEDTLGTLEYMSLKTQESLGLKDPPDVCLLVYEKPDNPCSERGGLIEWFRENGKDLEEWKQD